MQAYLTFLKAHEKLIIVVFIGVLGFFLVSKGIDAWVSHDKKESTAAAQVVAKDDTDTAAMKSQIATLTATVNAQNAALVSKIATTKAATKKQQQMDATLSPNDLAARVAKLINVPQAEVTVLPVSGDLELTGPAAVADAQQLELVPALQTEVAADNQIIANDNTIISKQNDFIVQLEKDVVDAKAQDAADVKELKAQAKKSWIHGFGWGFVSGVTFGLVVHH